MTLAAGSELTESHDLRAAFDLPVAFSVGGVLLFPTAKGRFVLARSVVVTSGLLHLHERVHRTQPEAQPMTAPGAWSPHITISMRLTAAQVASALPLLGGPIAGRVVGARLWDGAEKSITDLTRSGNSSGEDAGQHELADAGS